MIPLFPKERIAGAGNGKDVVHDDRGADQVFPFTFGKIFCGRNGGRSKQRPYTGITKADPTTGTLTQEPCAVLLPAGAVAAVGGGAAEEAVLAVVVALMGRAKLFRAERGAAGKIARAFGFGGQKNVERLKVEC